MTDLGPFWVGDNPASAFMLDLQDELIDADLDNIENATVDGVLLSPFGTTAATLPAAPLVDLAVNLTWLAPSTPLFRSPGKYTLVLTVRSDDLTRLLPPVPVVVQQVGDVISLSAVREAWKGAPENDGKLFDLIKVASDTVYAYGPSKDVGYEAIAQATIMQARNIWNGTAQNDDGQVGYGDFTAPVYPLDRQVKNLLRPRRAVPVVG